jgi:hypothetical protein
LPCGTLTLNMRVAGSAAREAALGYKAVESGERGADHHPCRWPAIRRPLPPPPARPAVESGERGADRGLGEGLGRAALVPQEELPLALPMDHVVSHVTTRIRNRKSCRSLCRSRLSHVSTRIRQRCRSPCRSSEGRGARGWQGGKGASKWG